MQNYSTTSMTPGILKHCKTVTSKPEQLRDSNNNVDIAMMKDMVHNIYKKERFELQ